MLLSSASAACSSAAFRYSCLQLLSMHGMHGMHADGCMGLTHSTLIACLPGRRRLLTLQAQLAKIQVRGWRCVGLLYVGALPYCALVHLLAVSGCRLVLRSCRRPTVCVLLRCRPQCCTRRTSRNAQHLQFCLQADADHTLAEVLPLQEQLDEIDAERCVTSVDLCLLLPQAGQGRLTASCLQAMLLQQAAVSPP